MGEYDDLLEEARSKAAAYMSTAKIYIPKMYNALINESKNISPQDARDRIEKDCIGIWSKRTILDALPDEVKNPEKQKSGRLGQKKRNFAAETAAKSSAPESPTAEIMLDTHGGSTDTESTIDESSKHRSKEQLKANEPATEQDQARLAAEQEPLKQEVLVDRSGQGTVQIDVTANRQIKSDSAANNNNNNNNADLKTASNVKELSLPSRQLHRYVASQRRKGKNEVWLTIKTNPTTGEIVYVKTGRNSESLGRSSFEVEYD